MNTREILERFRGLSALVAGDICLDRWCTYDPALAEPSRETGLPRTAVLSVECTPGAGGTVANNLAALGCGRTAVLGVTGEDGFAWELRRALAARGISGDLLLSDSAIQTFTYTKYWNVQTGAEDLPRTDFINASPLPRELELRLLGALQRYAPDFDVILVSDQAETALGGAVTPAVREAVSRLANRVVWADSRLRPELFRNVIVKPNLQEATEASRRLYGKIDFAALRRHIGPHPLVVTQGAEGARIYHEQGEDFVPARPVENPTDICGAGDSFSAAAALALAVTGDIRQAARLGNLAASVTIRKRGTGAASPDEILAAEE
jgi:rfaE bifunctional protein kinase chain/domain